MIPRSPTATTDWQRCPMLYRLKREWAPRGPWTPNRLLGTAIGDALSEHYRGADRPIPEETLRRVILEGFQDNDKWTREALVKLAQRGYERAVADGLRERGEVRLVDSQLPSRARPDLVQVVHDLGQIVTDTKVSLYGGEDRLSEYFTSHQLFHYAWELQEVYGEPVTWAYIHYITLLPRVDSLLHPVQITPERLKYWLAGAQRTWGQMERDEPAPQWSGCYSKYGPCEFIPACHVLHLDPDAMESAYDRIQARD